MLKKKTAENVGKLTFSWAASRAELKIMTAKEVPNLVVLWKITLFEVQSSRRQLGHLGPHGFQPGSLGAKCQPSDTVVGIGKGQGAGAIIVHTEEIAVARFQPLKKPRVEPARSPWNLGISWNIPRPSHFFLSSLDRLCKPLKIFVKSDPGPRYEWKSNWFSTHLQASRSTYSVSPRIHANMI